MNRKQLLLGVCFVGIAVLTLSFFLRRSVSTTPRRHSIESSPALAAEQRTAPVTKTTTSSAAVSFPRETAPFGSNTSNQLSFEGRVEPDLVRERPFVAFEEWLQRYQDADDVTKKSLEEEGEALAKTRLTALADLVKANPERALELELPFALRAVVPASLQQHIEEHINTRGDLAVIAALSDSPSEWVPPVMRQATIDGKQYQVFTYGKGLDFVTKNDVPLNGVAVPNDVASKSYRTVFGKPAKLLALSESPVRVLRSEEVKAREEARAKTGEPEPICSVSGKPVTSQNDETVIEFAGNLHAFCGKIDASWWANANIQASGLDKPSGSSLLPTAESSYTEGRKRMFCMRPYWTDFAPVLSTNEAITRFVAFSNYMWQMSYGKLQLAALGRGSEISPDMLLPGVVSDYDNQGLGSLYNTCKQVATNNYGYDSALSKFDFLYVMTGSQPAAGYCGLAFVGGVGFHIPCWGADVTCHEFGHNLGLNHAHFWDTSLASVVGAGQNVEYGDNNDPMGGGGNPNQYNSRYKNYLGWITNSDIAVIPATSSNRYRLYCFDLDYSTVGTRGIQFASSGTDHDNYWINFRQRKTGSAALMNGLQLLWTGNNNRGSYLLDVRLKGNADNNAIVIGRTFSDPVANFHFTPIGKGNTYPESMDVVVVSGAQPNNLPPTATLAASTLTPGAAQAVTFTATASDPNGDALAYYWEFGDGTESYSADNKPTQIHSFASAGEYAVRCVVSDMRGGTAQHTLVVRVGNPSVFRISGHVADQYSKPMAGALVRAGSKSVFTDSDGSYVVPGLAAGGYTMSAIEPVRGAVELTHPFFNNPVTVGPNAQNIDFIVGTSAPPASLVGTNAIWKYLDNGTDQGTAWQSPTFDDSLWLAGPSQLGYGEGDEATTNSYGGVAANKYITYYYRHHFNVPDPTGFTNLIMNLLRDDGVIVYLNGTEVFRDNMPTGAVTYTTFASSNCADDGKQFFTANISPSLLVAGDNVIAAEIHQDAINSSDITFYLALDSVAASAVVRSAIVYVSSPADNATFTGPTNITVNANAFSTPPAVANVEFYDGPTSLGSSASAPYSAVLNSAALGAHVFRAVSTDANGLKRTSAPVNITVSAPVAPPVALSFIQTNAAWRYFGTNFAAAAGWTNVGFNDSNWATGIARLGLNSGPNTNINTVIDIGPSNARYNTIYFRNSFVVNDPSAVTNLVLRLARDDGAVVYLNGSEIIRDNIQNGATITYSTFATNTTENGQTYFTFQISSAGLIAGTNVIAVEVHQSSATSSDLAFDLWLNGLASTNRARGCWLASPANGANISLPGIVTLSAEVVAGGNLGVTNVEFYSDGALIGQDTSSPFSFAWSNPPGGAHLLVAVAYDSTGASVTSAPVSITVNGAPIGDALISFGDVWKYLDDGSDQGTTWKNSAFNDNQWMAGPAQLGYGDGDEVTAVSYGTNANVKYVTTYFRKKFVAANPASYSGLLLRLIRDDGAVVYLNGTEIFRTNLLAGPISYNSLALAAIGGTDESTPVDVLLSTAGLIAGTNTIAVEMHQDSVTSSDLSFDLALIGLHNTNTSDGVYLISPANGAHYNMPATVSFSAYAKSSGGAISLVEYYDGTTKVGQGTTAPYSATWNGAASGTHTLTTVATFGAGQKMTSGPISIVVGPAPPPIAPVFTQFFEYGSQWSYWDSAGVVSNGWQNLGFDDSAWPAGNARFGWGLDGENTLLTSGRITHYFRKPIVIANGGALDSLTFYVVRDDGVIVYFNGIEVFRTNMPAGPVTGSTLASVAINTPDETTPVTYTVSTAGLGLLYGTNVVAVELHQNSANSSDASFDMLMFGEGTSEPRIYLGSPRNNSTQTVGSPIRLEANAQVPSGRTLTAVEFFSDGTNVGQIASLPYRVDWSGSSTGQHTIVARAIDNLGNSITSAPVQISVGYQPVSLVLVPAGSIWKYLDDGSDQGTNWAQPIFPAEAGWEYGPAELGYGDLPDGRPEATAICCSNGVHYITYYFRHQFVVPPDTVLTNLTFRLVRDDGAVVWLNGREMYRSNIISGPINYLTPATTAVGGADESTFFVTTMASTNAHTGTNLVAVEIHQQSVGSSDVSFDLQLEGDGYVLNTIKPLLTATTSGGLLRIAWPSSAAGFQLYVSPTIGTNASWQLVSGSMSSSNGFNVMTVPTTNTATFYQLQK